MYLSANNISSSSSSRRPSASCHRTTCQLIFRPCRPFLVDDGFVSFAFRFALKQQLLWCGSLRFSPRTDKQERSWMPNTEAIVYQTTLPTLDRDPLSLVGCIPCAVANGRLATISLPWFSVDGYCCCFCWCFAHSTVIVAVSVVLSTLRILLLFLLLCCPFYGCCYFCCVVLFMDNVAVSVVVLSSLRILLLLLCCQHVEYMYFGGWSTPTSAEEQSAYNAATTSNSTTPCLE